MNHETIPHRNRAVKKYKTFKGPHGDGQRPILRPRCPGPYVLPEALFYTLYLAGAFRRVKLDKKGPFWPRVRKAHATATRADLFLPGLYREKFNDLTGTNL